MVVSGRVRRRLRDADGDVQAGREKLSGHYSGQLGEAPLAGTLKGNAIEFTIDVSVQGTDVHIVYSGTVEKDSMKGKVKLGDFGDGSFTAKKKS